jgi:hypothetical protein
MSLNKQEFTDAGQSMLGRAQAGEVLTISKIVVGSGSATAASQLWPLTALMNHELDVVISAQSDNGAGTLTVEGSFDSNAAAAAFQLRELGVMAHIGAEADRLYSVANVLATAPETVDPASISVHAFKIKLIVDRATTVNVTIGTSTDILAENVGLDTVGPGWFKEKLLNTLRFKRIVAGEGINVVEDTNQDYVIVETKRLKVDLDLYVALANPDVSPNFSTIQNAINYLKSYAIPSDRRATIHVSAETHTAPVVMDHLDGHSIYIVGAAPVSKTISQFTNVDANNFKVTLNDVTGLAVGQAVIVAGYVLWAGCHQIMAIAGNVVTLSKDLVGGVGTTASGAYTATLWRYPSVIGITSGNPLVGQHALNLENFTILGGGPAQRQGGIIIQDGGTLKNICERYCMTGVLVQEGVLNIYAGNNAFALNTWGIASSGSGNIVGEYAGGGFIIANGNSNIGFWAHAGGSIGLGPFQPGEDNRIMSIGNGSGFYASATATLGITRAYASFNTYGVVGESNATVNAFDSNTTPWPNVFTGNNLDALARNAGCVILSLQGGSIGTTNPASGVLGNNAGLIVIQ